MRKGADQRDRHRRQRNDRRAPGLQKNDDDNDDQQNRFQQRMNDGLNRMPDENRRVINDRVVHAFGEIFLQLLHLGADVFGKLQRIRAGRLENRDRHRRLVVEQRMQRVAAGAQLDAGHILEQGFFAVRPGLDDDVAEFLLGNQPAFDVDLQFKIHRTR